MNTQSFELNGVKITVREGLGRDAIVRPSIHYILGKHLNIMSDDVPTDPAVIRKLNMKWSSVSRVTDMILRTVSADGVSVPPSDSTEDVVTAFYDVVMDMPEELVSVWLKALDNVNMPKKTD